MTKVIPILGVVALILALLRGKAEEDVRKAAPARVANGPTPAHGLQTMQLEEMWRVGGADDEENFFGLVTWAEAGADGLVYVLDTQLCQVNVYDREGNLVQTLFRQGEGPGEVQRPAQPGVASAVDHYDLAALEHPDFYPDGRDLGENYTYTLWLMSPCVQSGRLGLGRRSSSGAYSTMTYGAHDGASS